MKGHRWQTRERPREMKPDHRRVACTVITADHLHYAVALERSLAHFADVDFVILVTDTTELPREYENLLHSFPSMSVRRLSDVYDPVELRSLRERFAQDPDALRWASKSRLLIHLLDRERYAAALYLDSDLFFYSDCGFLFDELEDHAILLTPHWRTIDPEKNPIQFEVNFNHGLYNAGFLGASQDGLPALAWWHQISCFSSERDGRGSLYADQSCLNLLPLHFDGVHVLQHRGCNVAEWNKESLSRHDVDGRVVIADEWPLVFVHFTGITIDCIEAGEDPGLERVLREYKLALVRANLQLGRLTPPERANRLVSEDQVPSHFQSVR